MSLFRDLAGLGLITSAYNNLGNIGDTAYNRSQILAQLGLDQSQFKPFSVTTGTGSNVNVSDDGSINMMPGGVESALSSSLLNQAGQFIGGVDPSAFSDSSSQAFGLGSDFMNQLGTSTADREADIFNRIRAAQRPEEERQSLALEERLANQGRLGVSTSMFGGTPEQLALNKAREEAKQNAMIAAMGQARAEQAQTGELARAFTGLGGDLANRGQQMGMSAFGGAYLPQAQLLNALQQGINTSGLAQRGQLYGANLFGESSMSGLEALLGAGLGQTKLIGDVGQGLLRASASGSGGLFDFLDGLF